jgi:hypothetical protein
LSDFDILWTTKERREGWFEKTINMSGVYNFLKCHRNVNKQTKPLQVDDLITNKSLAILEASRRIMNTHCVKISVLANMKNFLKTS